MTDGEYEELVSLLGEGFHTAFRKATDCPQAHPIWELINEMPGKDWLSVVDWVAEQLREWVEERELLNRDY